MAYIIRKPNLMLIKSFDMTFSLASHPNLINLNKEYFYIDIPKSGSSFIKSSIIQHLIIYIPPPLSSSFYQILQIHNTNQGPNPYFRFIHNLRSAQIVHSAQSQTIPNKFFP